MNFETYKNLTYEQKEEYNYKYKNKKSFDITNILYVIIIFFLHIMLVICLLLIANKTDGILSNERMQVYLGMIGILLKVLLPFVIINVLYMICVDTWNYISERRWMSINYIERKGKWWHK